MTLCGVPEARFVVWHILQDLISFYKYLLYSTVLDINSSAVRGRHDDLHDNQEVKPFGIYHNKHQYQ